MSNGSGATFAERIDAIEEAYEFMLAYAAQGREDDSGPGESIREFLTNTLSAIDGIADSASDDARAPAGDAAWANFVELLRQDAERARVSIALVLARPAIGSGLIDNLNASIHVRTLLTDLFLVDDVLKTGK